MLDLFLAAAYRSELMNELGEQANEAAIAQARPLLERCPDRDLEPITTHRARRRRRSSTAAAATS